MTLLGLAGKLAIVLVLAAAAAGCSGATDRIRSVARGGDGCINAAIDYAPVLQFEGRVYHENDGSDNSGLKAGAQIGKIGYTLADNACLGYKLKDGDATLLATGTKLYEVVGYDRDYRILAGEKLYEASDNPEARLVGDLYDIDGKIAGVSFVSGNDGSLLKAFAPEAAAAFAEQYVKLRLVDRQQLAKETHNLSGNSWYMRVRLEDGTSFGLTYNILHGVLSPGAYAGDELKKLIEEQRQRVYAKEEADSA